MTAPHRLLQVELHLAYCAWLLLHPAAIARYSRPTLPRWVELFVDVVQSDPESRPADERGQRYRRAIIAGATAAEPFPGEVRAKAILVESLVRRMSIEQLRASGGPGEVCRLLGCEPKVKRPAAWRIDLAIATRQESAA